MLGESALNHTVQDNFKWKLGYDFTPTIHAAYTLGLGRTTITPALTVFYAIVLAIQLIAVTSILAESNITSAGLAVLPLFAETRAEQMHWSHGMNIKSTTGGVFDWDLAGSVVEYGTDLSRTSTQTPALAARNGAGRTTSLTGTGWHTADAKGIWRPGVDLLGKHEVSFGFHHDLYNLDNPVYNATNWQTSNGGSIFSDSQGKTQTEGYWAQDSWDFDKKWNLTLGGRLENWHAFDGYNAATVGTALRTINQSNQNDLEFSPKAKLTWKPADRANRFSYRPGLSLSYRNGVISNHDDDFGGDTNHC